MQTSTALLAYSLCTLSPYISSFILGVEVPIPLILPAQLNQREEREQPLQSSALVVLDREDSQEFLTFLGLNGPRECWCQGEHISSYPICHPCHLYLLVKLEPLQKIPVLFCHLYLPKLFCESINIMKIPVLFSFVYLATRGVVTSIMSSLIPNMLW